MALFFSNTSHAEFLSFDTTTKIKQRYKDPKIAKMMKMMPGAGASEKPTNGKTYVHGGRMIVFEDGKPQTLHDFPNSQIIIFHQNSKKKTYSVMSVKSMANMAKKMSDDTKVKSDYVKLKKKNKISGKTCQFYKSNTETSINNAAKTNMSSVHCIWLKPPVAWTEYQMAALKAFKPHIHKLAKISTGRFIADLGMPLYTKTKMDIMPASMKGNPQMANMLPETYNIDRVLNISTKPFDTSIMQIPSGYKKAKRKKKSKKSS